MTAENFSWHNFLIFLAAAVLKLHQDKALSIISDGIVYTYLRTILMKCLKWKTKLEFVRQAVRCWRKSCNINSLFVVENACRPIKTRAGWRTAERTQWDEWLVCYNIAARGGNAVFGVVMDGDCRKNELKTCLPRECARVRPGQVLRPGGQFRRKHHLSSGWIPPIVDLFKIKINS